MLRIPEEERIFLSFNESLSYHSIAYQTLYINVFLFCCISMSFHRVLPRPPALSNRGLTNRWAIGTDSLESAKIMPDERSKGAFLNNDQIPVSSQSEPGSRTSSTQLEEYHSNDVGQDDNPQSDPSGETQIPHRVRKPAPSNIDTWQRDSPSQICLCQPDLKIPRPRNGTSAFRDPHTSEISRGRFI